MMHLRSLVEMSADAVLQREMNGFATEKLMTLEAGGMTDAAGTIIAMNYHLVQHFTPTPRNPDLRH